MPERLRYLDHLFRGADWLGSHYRSWFTRALRARYALWALMAFLLLSFKKDSFGWAGLGAISGVLIVFGARAGAGALGAPTQLASQVPRLPRAR